MAEEDSEVKKFHAFIVIAEPSEKTSIVDRLDYFSYWTGAVKAATLCLRYKKNPKIIMCLQKRKAPKGKINRHCQ